MTRTPARVVLLGASGFVGRSLAGHLNEAEIHWTGFGSRDLDLSQPESSSRLAEVLRSEDALVMVSALTPDKGKDVRTLLKNLRMAESVAEALESASCAHVVYLSSDAVYSEEAHPVREATACHPSSYHGLMHLTREQILTQVTRRRGIPLWILRPSLLYGAEDTHNGYGPNRFLRSALAERKIVLFGEGEEKRDHVYVRDLAHLILQGLLDRFEGMLNIATGESLSFREVAALIAGLFEEEVRIDRAQRHGTVTHRHFDTSRLIRSFPRFSFTPLSRGLAEAYGRLREDSHG